MHQTRPELRLGRSQRMSHRRGIFLLIYQLDGNTVIFVRIGTRSDLFEE
jgi:mRNA interferase YafQ